MRPIKLSVEEAVLLASAFKPVDKVWYRRADLIINLSLALVSIVLAFASYNLSLKVDEQKLVLDKYITQSDRYRLGGSLTSLDGNLARSLDSADMVNWINTEKPFLERELTNPYLMRDSEMMAYWYYAYQRVSGFKYSSIGNITKDGRTKKMTPHEVKVSNITAFAETYRSVADAILTCRTYIQHHAEPGFSLYTIPKQKIPLTKALKDSEELQGQFR